MANNRIDNIFKTCREEGRKALVMYLTAGDPDLETSKELIPAIVEAGADILEVGVPFSEPMADGPTIQLAAERALASGTTLTKILDMIREIRKTCDVPIVLFSYFNVLLKYGLDKLAADSKEIGIDGWLVVDVPHEESTELRPHLEENNIHLIPLMAPTTPKERAAEILKSAGGFVYYITVTGVTGARKDVPTDLAEHLGMLKSVTDLPVVAGFGVSSPETAKKVGEHADGVVVGSALVKIIASSANKKEAVEKSASFVGSLADVMKQSPS